MLNIMHLMSGISTMTNKYVQRLKGTHTRVLDTRKTTPGIHAGYAFFVSRTVTLEPELYFDISTKGSDYMCYGLRVGVGVYLFKDQYQIRR